MLTNATPGGIPIYACNNIPPYLVASYVQLKQEGLCPACANQPDGCYRRAPRWIWLYDRRCARPYTCRTKQGQAGTKALQTKRERYSCGKCAAFRNDWRWIRALRKTGGLCPACFGSEQTS